MSNQSLLHDIGVEAGKAAPPIAVTSAHYLLGLSLSDWVAIITLIYLALQIGLLVPKYRYQFAQWRQKRREARKCSRSE